MQMLSKTISIAKAAKTTVMCHFCVCVCVWELWFVRIIHKPGHWIHLNRVSPAQSLIWLIYANHAACSFSVDQVLYAYNKKRQVTYQKNVLNCWVNIFFFVFFFSFHLAFSSCGSLLYLLQEDCRQSWLPAGCEIHWQGKQFLVKAHLVLPLRLADEGTFPREGVCTVWLLRAPAHPSFCQPSLEGGFTMIAKAGASLWVEDVQEKLPWFTLVLSARSLGFVPLQTAVKRSR